MRLAVTESAATPQIREFSAWKVEDELLSVSLDMARRCQISIRRGASGEVDLHCSNLALSLKYTLDGSDPGPGSTVYEKPLALTNGGTVKAYANGGAGGVRHLLNDDPR